MKSKNVKQTELVAALREAITRTAEHFHCLDPHHSSTVSSRGRWPPGVRRTSLACGFTFAVCVMQDLTPDYSMESHHRDHENFLVVSRNRRRRAKALLDFERHDDDELGFRKNDIITVSLRPWRNLLFRVTSVSSASPFSPPPPIVFRSSHRGMSTAGSESSTASEVPSLILALLRYLPFGSLLLTCCLCFAFQRLVSSKVCGDPG